MPHYQKASGDGRHVFYNSIASLTFVNVFGDNLLTNTMDFFNPFSDIKEILDLLQNSGGDYEEY